MNTKYEAMARESHATANVIQHCRNNGKLSTGNQHRLTNQILFDVKNPRCNYNILHHHAQYIELSKIIFTQFSLPLSVKKVMHMLYGG